MNRDGVGGGAYEQPGAALTSCHESLWDVLAPAQRTSQAGSPLHRHRSLWPQAPTAWVDCLGSHRGENLGGEASGEALWEEGLPNLPRDLRTGLSGKAQPEGVKILTLRRVIEKKTNVGSSSLLQIPPSSWGTEAALLCREEQEGRARLLVPGESSAESRYKSIPR